MNKLIIPAVLVATAMFTTSAWSQTPAPAFQNKRYFTMPLEKDPTREVGLQSVTMPPGAGNQFHRHPGEQWTAVQEGEVTFTVQGKPPQVFDSNGALQTKIGSGLINDPHGFHVDREGNVWVSDTVAEGGKGQTVTKFSKDGKVLMTLGKPGVTGDANSTDTFDQPTDIYVAPNGDIFVSQGHGARPNDRIFKFSKDGKYIKSWGKRGSGPGEFNTPHQLAMDSTGRLFVADRVNNRIQIFDQDGKFLEEWKQFGRPSGLYIDKNDNVYSADHHRGRLLGYHLRRLDRQYERASLDQGTDAIELHSGEPPCGSPGACFLSRLRVRVGEGATAGTTSAAVDISDQAFS